MHTTERPTAGDALVLVDVQQDFLPGGALGVPDGDAVVPVLNDYVRVFSEQQLPVFATRDWHPADHCSFTAQGGPWPPHCVAGTDGAKFASALRIPDTATIVSKATGETDAYSGFEGTELHARLESQGVGRLFVGGLATDYCVLNTVLDALRLGYQVRLITDAVRAVNVTPGGGEQAMTKMLAAGAVAISGVQATQ